MIEMISVKEVEKKFSDARVQGELYGIAESEAFKLLMELVEEKAAQCEGQVTRFVRPDANRTTEQILIDNNRYATIADSLRYVPRMVEAALESFGRKGRK